MLKAFKKLVLVTEIIALITKAGKKDDVVLAMVLRTYYLLRFHKNKENEFWALIIFSNKINAVTPVYISKLGFQVYYTNIGA